MRKQFDTLRVIIGALAAGALSTAGLLLAQSGDVAAPEPARLNGSLYGGGSSASATYVNSGVPTWGYQWPGSWAVGNIPPGMPCATYNAGPGITLTAVIIANGNYRKCGDPGSSGNIVVTGSRTEPASLDVSLAKSPASATFVKSKVKTWAYQLSGTWVVAGSMPPGLPCATYAAPAGAVLTAVIRASGAYRKCQ